MASAESDEREPDRIGEFRILQKLGQGGMGVVYLAYQESLQREVALKVLTRGGKGHERDVIRFLRESLVAGKLESDHIVKVYAVGEEEGTHYFAMEYVRGQSCEKHIEAQRAHKAGTPGSSTRGIDVKRAAEIVRHAADALDCAHRAGVIHRDVKPQNILLGSDGRVKLADFGIAKVESDFQLTRPGQTPGTPYYMSPEQWYGTRYPLTGLSDIFSLGVVLYELLTLTRPFTGGTVTAVLEEIAFKHPASLKALNPKVPRDLETTCYKCLEKRPRDRYQSAAELREDLDRFLRFQPILAKRPSWAVQMARRAILRPARAVIGLTAAASLLTGAVLATAWANRDASRRPRITIESVPPGASVYARPVSYPDLEPATGERSDLLGTTPLIGAALEPGQYRFAVVKDDKAFAELTEELVAGAEPLVVHAPIVTTDAATAGMRRIEGGPFKFGSPRYTESGIPLRARTVKLEPFWMDETEVSNGDYLRFVEAMAAGGAPVPRPLSFEDATIPGWADLPVAGVSQGEAAAYARWRGKRLPTLFEWERAARGTHGALYPWTEPPAAGVNATWLRREGLTLQEPKELYSRLAAPVRQCEPPFRGPEGLLHLFNNVSEWTETRGCIAFRFKPDLCFLEGGHVASTPDNYDFTRYDCVDRSVRDRLVGFRCAKSVRPFQTP